MKFYSLLLFTLALISCEKPKSKSDLFDDGRKLGSVSNDLVEASGLVASRANPRYLWSHNDSGNPAEVFLIDEQAKIKLTVRLKDINNRDFEDIAIGGGPDPKKNYIYLADIGDNLAVYPQKIIYRFEEPLLSSEDRIELLDFDTLVVELPDQIRDSETLMIDPISKDMILVSKREESVLVYRIDNPGQSDTLMAEIAGKLPLHKIVAGDISSDGREVLMKDYDHIYYWKKKASESIFELLKSAPIELSYDREPQGESIAWSVDGSGFYTLSETVKDKRGKLIYYTRNR